jgi:hypothetical protein
MVALKLQMGINPSTKIAPNILLAMWHQLKLERVQTKRRNPSQEVRYFSSW